MWDDRTDLGGGRSEQVNLSEFSGYSPAGEDPALGAAALPARHRTSPVEILSLTSDVVCVTYRLTIYGQNSRILYSASQKAALAIDPAGHGEILGHAINSRRLTLQGIYETHFHPDHCGGAWWLKKEFADKGNPAIYGSTHPMEDDFRARVESFNEHLRVREPTMKNCPGVDSALKEGDTFSIGDMTFAVIETPGHSPGHLSFHCAEAGVLISGDLIFQSGPAPLKIPGGSPDVFWPTVARLKKELPGETISLAGHSPNMRLGDWDVTRR